VLCRDAELAELTRLLDAADCRPVLLLGPRLVGKTALLHEYVFRKVLGQRSKFRARRNVWLLAPARLISGMSYVGQWENRLLAILKEARRRQHLLYFDDLLGLFLAGQSGSSDLSAADVLKPYLERRDVRVLGEITPEAFRVLREKDRGFADLFHLVPLAEPDDKDNLRIQIAVQRSLEGAWRCRFDLEALPTVLDLQRRYNRAASFPGKGASFLRQLAVKHRGTEVKRGQVLEEFRLRSGLAATFLDKQARLDRQDVIDGLGKQVVGQDAALQAAADVIAVAKARLNDPERPLAAFLFLGPTGVGKTQCAKAIAAYLFGDGDRLLRFDLNEYSQPGAAARLVGTFWQPEGLLTSAIRRQPFAVVLFDEVEKAHPEVFDILLQVLGEGRLTDALGRTADFGNALIVLTSNLGVKESESHVGLRAQEEAERDAGFVRAAERFFRPEFFNRLDRIIPFRRLTREQVRQIADLLIRDVFAREGLAQRKCMLEVDAEALERIVDRGFDPVLGARALKRSIERHLTQPVALQLSALPPGDFSLVRVYPGPDQLAVHVEALSQVPTLRAGEPEAEAPDDLARRLHAELRHIEEDFAPLRPRGPITAALLSPEQDRYLALREQMDQVRAELRRLEEALEARRTARRIQAGYRVVDAARTRTHQYRMRRRCYDVHDAGSFLRELAAALDINEYLNDLAASASVADKGGLEQDLQALHRQMALLRLRAQCLRSPPAATRVLLWCHPLASNLQMAIAHAHKEYVEGLRRLYLETAEVDGGEALRKWGDRLVLVEGPHAWPLVQLEVGTYLYCFAHQPTEPVCVQALPLADDAEPGQALGAALEQRQAWRQRLLRGDSTCADDPLRPGPVVRIIQQLPASMDVLRTFDIRTGLIGTSRTAGEDLADFLLGSLEPGAV